jgi:hypothetical protein
MSAIAYEEATRRGWKTVGVACSQALDYDCFPVHEAVIVGRSWGDESEVFLERIDLVIRIGGGNQSRQEVDLAKLQGKRVIEFELPALVEVMVPSGHCSAIPLPNANHTSETPPDFRFKELGCT